MLQRIFMITVIVSLVLGGGYYSYRQLMPPPVEEVQGPVYAAKEVVRGDIAVGVEATGPLNPADHGAIRVPGGYGPRQAGAVNSYIIDEVLAEEGDEVKKGQVLVRLTAPDLDTNIEAKKDQLEADREYLADLMGIPLSEVDNINPAQGITLRAPITGRVQGLSVIEGTDVKQGTIVARVVDDSSFKLTAKLTPTEWQRGVSMGRKAVLRFEEFGNLVKAKVTSVNPSPIPVASSELFDAQYAGGNYDEDQYQLTYWVTIEGENPGLIRPGMRAQIGLVKDDGSSSEEISPTSISWLRYYSKVESYVDEETVLSKAEAIATKVFVHEMEMVEKGDPIVSLAGEDARDKIEEKLDEIRDVETELRQMQSQMDQLEVIASIDGIVADIGAQPGETVEPGRYFGSVYTTSNMRMWTEIDDVDVLLVRQGAPVDVTVDALPGKSFEGEVMHVSQMGRDQNGIARFQVNIQVTGGPELRPGMQAKAHIDAGSAEGVLLVPLEAIFEEDGQPKVEVLQEDGTVKVIAIELGLMNDRVAEVKSGLEEGQKVITGSTEDLLPSQHIGSKDSILPSNDDGDGGEEPGDQPTNGGERSVPAK